jgi:hypothetical protein
MENRYKISHTAFPDGSIIKYLYGMDKPEIKNLGDIMKTSLFKVTQEKAAWVKQFKLGEQQLSKAMYAMK